jgi:predicted P-loop ATPase
VSESQSGPGGPGSSVIPFRASSAEEHAKAETGHKQQLFDWADRVLKQMGIIDKISQATSFDDLRKIVFDADTTDVELAIRDALHPVGGRKADCFAGMKEGGLKRILKSRFDEMKRERDDELRNPGRHGGAPGAKPAYNWTDDLRLDAKGGVRPYLANLILFLRYHPKWAGVFAYNEFTAQVVINKRPPWGDEAPDTVLTDHHESLARTWFQREDIGAAMGDVGRAVQAAARSKAFHPVRDYFDALVWDGVPRLDTWLVTYLHVDDSEYARAVGPRFLISAVARIYQPGCKVDHVLVLEGPQGKLKSEALRTLAVRDAWFADRLSHVASKDAAQETAGVLVIEVAEMDALTRAAPSAMKAFITRRYDRFRPPFGKHPINRGRQCIFAGTINPTVGGYLKDPTGARRIWPVTCHGMIDRDGIERDRDQIWAEAVTRFHAGAKWWLETQALEALANVEQAARFKTDVWKAPIEKWIGKKKDISIAEVLEKGLGFAPRDVSHSAEIRIASILTDLGFTQIRPRNADGGRSRRYSRE